MRFRLSKPTPAFVVAVAALVVSLGGTSYAVSQIGSPDIRDNAVRSIDIHDDTIRSADIRDGAVRSKDIADGTLQRRDFRDGVLLRGATGPRGPQGVKGDEGDQGIQGPAGVGRWALIDESGAIVAQSGGFTVSDAYVTNNNIYLDANEDLTDNGVVSTIAIQNQIDRDPVTDGIQGTFSGEISSTRCGIASVVVCAPAGTNDARHFVVSPRNSDGSATTSTTRKRFYVIITGDSSDYVPAS